ncbi:hypothetical protein ACODT4_44720 [Streptomyces sp. 2.9]|uniref:hypothetical protein n=1 Tax=Streptomyces tritrimontium TaxID=3406573 RepID=UPI003BB697E9
MAVAKMSFHIALPEHSMTRLIELAEAEQEHERKWIAERRRELMPPSASRRAAADIRRGIRVEVATKRRTGEFGGSRDDLLTRAVREELRARGLDREWPDPPEGEVDAPGRRWGTPPSQPLGAGGYNARLSLNLPADLGETIRRAAYWTSKPAVEALQEWADRWGDGVEVAMREAARDGFPAEFSLVVAAGQPSAPQAVLEIREALRAKVLTTGDLIRAAVARCTNEGQTETPSGA